VNAENDWDIPYSHSCALFNAFLDLQVLSELPTISKDAMCMNMSSWDVVPGQQTLQSARCKGLVSHLSIDNFGTLDEFVADHRRVALLRTARGGHDLPKVEGVQDAIGRMFDLF